jgi:hypothetical protein
MSENRQKFYKYSFLQFLTLSFLILALFVLVNLYRNQVFDIRSSAKQNNLVCSGQFGGICINANGCSARGGYNLGTSGCVGNTTCCYLGENTPTPTPVPPLTLEYQGENIKVTTQCSAGGSVNIFIIDDGVDEAPNGTWTYMVMPNGEYAYLAYTSVDNGNSSASVYAATNPIRGDVRETIQSSTTYTAGIAHGEYTLSTPVLVDPRYELDFETPACN